MLVYGHQQHIGALRAYLPSASLFLGPRHVGKWTVAEHLRAHHGFTPDAVLRTRALTMDAARILVRFSQLPGPRLTITRLDPEHRHAFPALLKVLEDENETQHILVSAQHPGATLASRLEQFDFYPLPTPTVEEALRARGVAAPEAARLARLSAGRIGEAIDAVTHTEDDARPLVLSALAAILERDRERLRRCAPLWTPGATTMLTQWCVESITQRTRHYTEAQVGVERALALRILMSTRNVNHPRLVVRGALMSVLEKMSA